MRRDKQTARLEEWTRFQGRLMGKVYGHPGHEDGTDVTTSPVISSPDSVKEGGEVTTHNTIYTLGSEYKIRGELI